MSTLSIIRKGLSRSKRMLFRNRLDRYSNFSQQGIQLSNAAVAPSRFCDDRGLNKGNRGYPAMTFFEQVFRELVSFLLAQQDG